MRVHMRVPMRVPFHNIMRMAQICAIFIMMCVIIIGVVAAEKNVIIGFNKPVGPSEKALIQSHGGVVKKSFHLIPAIVAKVPENNITKMKKDGRVTYIEEEKVYRPTDEYSSSLGVQYIGSQSVHNRGIYGDGVKIAVLDTGIDYNHPDLVENYKGGVSFVDYTIDPFDDSGHGTHVAGIIAAKNNGVGTVGVAPNSNIYAVKVLHPAGGVTSWIISGIEWAVNNNMDIATMSLNCFPGPFITCDDIALQNAIDNAYNSGLLLIGSGGNTNGGDVLYPAAYGSVIAVTATDQNDYKAGFSPIGSKIELAALGVNILSTVPTGSCIMCDSSGYKYLSGTSMAAPHVTGVAALIISNGFGDINGDGAVDNKDVRVILQNTARDIGTPGKDNVYGYGMVDASMSILGFPNKLVLVRTKGSPSNDLKRVNLSQGNYSLTIHSDNLSEIEMKVYDNGTLRKDISSVYKFNKSKDVNVELIVKNKFEVVFIPYDSKGSTGYVTIRRNK